MNTHTIHLRSGATITFKAERLALKTKGDELLSWEVEGASGDVPMYLHLEDVIAITTTAAIS